MFSIIIPLYNKASYIEKVIQSVFAQTYQSFELIVVNDGSTDNGLEIVQHINESVNQQINVIKQPNVGVAAARNNGVKVAKYDFIAFLDADDWWEPTFLEEMKILIEQYPDAGIYGSSYYKVKNGNNIQANIGVGKDFIKGYINYFIAYAKTLWMPLWTGAVVIPKSIFEKEKGFKSQLKLGEDFDLWVRVALTHKVAFYNRPLAYYNQDVELKSRAVGKLHDPQTHMLWNLDYLKEEEFANKDLKQLLDNLRVYSLYPYYLSKQYHLQAKRELEKVDWEKQTKSTIRKYKMPVFILRLRYAFMKMGSKIKRILILSCKP